jgi:hypothetical protein
MPSAAPFPSPLSHNPVSPVQPRRSGIKWKFVVLAGLAGAILVMGGLVTLGNAAKNWDMAGTFGVPKDLPVYPNATLIGVHENVTPGETRVDASWQADASLSSVAAFYAEELDIGSWQITKRDPVTGVWEFRHSDGKVRGLIQLSGHGQQTRIDVSLLK